MDELIYWIISAIAYFFIILSITFGFKNLRDKHRAFHKFLLALLIVSLASDLASLISIYAMQLANYPILHTYTIVEFTLLTLLYRSVFQNGHLKKAVLLCIVAFFVFKLFDLLFVTSIYKADTTTVITESLIMIVLSVLYFGQLIVRNDIKLTQFPMFYINSAILFYFSGSFLLFLYGTYIYEEASTYYVYWCIHNVLLVIRNVLFLVAMVLLGRPEASYIRKDELIAHE